MASPRKFTYSPAPKQVVAIVNPRSGMGGGQRVLRLLQKQHWAAKVATFETIPGSLEAHSEAIRYALRMDADRLLVAGGDGTLMETLTAMRALNAFIPIAMIPTGTGNIVANDLEAPRRILPAIRQAFNPGAIRWWDAGYLPDHNIVFALRASAGFEASVIHTMDDHAKQRWGVIAYAVPALREFLKAAPIEFTLQIDDQPPFTMEGIVAFVAVTSRITGAIDFVISRDIRPDDGVLHLGIFHPRNLLENLPALLNRGALEAKNMMSIFPVKHQARIDSTPPQITQVDGEPLGTTPLVVQTLPHAAAFVTPFVPRGRARWMTETSSMTPLSLF